MAPCPPGNRPRVRFSASSAGRVLVCDITSSEQPDCPTVRFSDECGRRGSARPESDDASPGPRPPPGSASPRKTPHLQRRVGRSARASHRALRRPSRSHRAAELTKTQRRPGSYLDAVLKQMIERPSPLRGNSRSVMGNGLITALFATPVGHEGQYSAPASLRRRSTCGGRPSLH